MDSGPVAGNNAQLLELPDGESGPVAVNSASAQLTDGDASVEIFELLDGDVTIVDVEKEDTKIDVNLMLVDMVVKVVMKHTKMDDLKNARLVCKLWKEFATKEMETRPDEIKAQNFGHLRKIDDLTKDLQHSQDWIFLGNSMRLALKELLTSESSGSFLNKFCPKNLSIVAHPDDVNVNIGLTNVLRDIAINLGKLSISYFWEVQQFGDSIVWPEDLKFQNLKEFSVNFPFYWKERTMIRFFINNILKNSSNLQVLEFCDQPYGLKLANYFSSLGIISKLSELRIFYAVTSDDGQDPVFGNDLFNMGNAGLRLRKFAISVRFEHYLDQEVILNQLDKLGHFLVNQSDTMTSLDISLDFERNFKRKVGGRYIQDIGFVMPPLPNLQFLKLSNAKYPSFHENTAFYPINLTRKLPNLKEIHLDLKADFHRNGQIHNLFFGSSINVDKIVLTQPDWKVFVNYSRYIHLEEYFPYVKVFEINHIDDGTRGRRFKNHQLVNNYEMIPWKDTLKILKLHIRQLRELGSFVHLKELERLEIIKQNDWSDGERTTIADSINIKALASTTIKSLYIKNFEIVDAAVNKIRKRFVFDYRPPK